MDLEKLFNLICSSPNIKIVYTNINGEEKLLVNDEEVVNEEPYDDSEIKKMIAEYKENVDLLDDCLFLEIFEELGEDMCLKELDALLRQDSYTEEEADLVKGKIKYIYTCIKEHLYNKIDSLYELASRF